MREQVLFFALRQCIAEASRDWFRVLQFSVQSDHVHLVVEANDKSALRRGTAGLEIRAALRLNRMLHKRGPFWGDRYHARALKTPNEVRRGLVYVLMNWKKHAPKVREFDPCSSAWWFDGWMRPPQTAPPGWKADEPPVERATKWLTTVGWRRRGLIERGERPTVTDIAKPGILR